MKYGNHLHPGRGSQLLENVCHPAADCHGICALQPQDECQRDADVRPIPLPSSETIHAQGQFHVYPPVTKEHESAQEARNSRVSSGRISPVAMVIPVSRYSTQSRFALTTYGDCGEVWTLPDTACLSITFQMITGRNVIRAFRQYTGRNANFIVQRPFGSA